MLFPPLNLFQSVILEILLVLAAVEVNSSILLVLQVWDQSSV